MIYPIITVLACVFQGWAVWYILRLSRRIRDDLMTLNRPKSVCTCGEESMTPGMTVSGKQIRSCPIHETNLALPIGLAHRHTRLPHLQEPPDYRHAPCPTCGQIVRQESP
jgi:hypothetical protein